MKTERKYLVSADVDVSVIASSKKEAVAKAEEALKFLDIQSMRVNPDKRSLPQNRSLHLLFTQLSKECLDKGIEMRKLVREEIPITATPENLKWYWKVFQEGMFKTKSTTELKKTGEIDEVYEAFNKEIIDERTLDPPSRLPTA